MEEEYNEGKVIYNSSHLGILALKELLKPLNVNVQLSGKSEDFETITSLNSPFQPSFVSSYKPTYPGTQQEIAYEDIVAD